MSGMKQMVWCRFEAVIIAEAGNGSGCEIGGTGIGGGREWIWFVNTTAV